MIIDSLPGATTPVFLIEIFDDNGSSENEVIYIHACKSQKLGNFTLSIVETMYSDIICCYSPFKKKGA